MMGDHPVSSDPLDPPGFWESSPAFPKYAIAIMMAGSIIFLIVLFLVAPEQMATTRAALPVFLSLLAIVAWLFLSRGKIKTSAQVLVVGLWGYVTAVSFFFGGLHAMVIIVYPLVIMMSGWLLGARSATLLAVLSVFTSFVFLLAESRDFLPRRPPTPPALIWIVQAFVFAASAVLIVQLLKSYQKRLKELRRVGSDLAQRTAEVQEREADLNRAQSVAQIGSWVYDIADDAIALSSETCRIFGLPQNTKGSHDTYMARAHPEDRSALDLAWLETLKGEPFDHEHRIMVGKEIRWVRQKAEVDSASPPLRIVGTTQDITERRRAGEALRESEDRFRQMFARNDAAMLLSEPESGAIVDANLAASNFYGYSVERLRTLRIDQISTLTTSETAAESALATSHGRSTANASHRLANGAIRSVEVHSSAIDVAGRVLLFSIIHDITARKMAEVELVATKAAAEGANNAKSRFLAAASHDLRQPLSALSLYVGVLSGRVSPDNVELAGKIQDCVDSLSELLTDLLDVSKLDAGVVTPKLSDFAIADLMESLVSVHSGEAALKRLRLRTRRCSAVAHSDQQLLRRILGNLVANAIRYTEKGGVLIACRRRQGRLWVEVWDTGMGIPEDKNAIIFEEFRQLGDNARSRGSGLGLAIVAKTAALLGLEIRLQSRQGRGSMFAVELPSGGAIEPDELPDFPPQTRFLRIALADDNAKVLQALALALENNGHEVFAATSGRALLERLDHRAPDIVIADYRLGEDETGFEVISLMRNLFGEELPALLITGDTDPRLIRNMADRGIAVHYKPLQIDALLAFIRKAGERRLS